MIAGCAIAAALANSRAAVKTGPREIIAALYQSAG
jgi:hypothetical protein